MEPENTPMRGIVKPEAVIANGKAYSPKQVIQTWEVVDDVKKYTTQFVVEVKTEDGVFLSNDTHTFRDEEHNRFSENYDTYSFLFDEIKRLYGIDDAEVPDDSEDGFYIRNNQE